MARTLSEGDDEQKRAALSAINVISSKELCDAVIALANSAPSWSIRSRAAAALASVRGDALVAQTVAALEKLAAGDSYALVRETALQALHGVAGKDAATFIRTRATEDSEEQVRKAAQTLIAP